MATMQKDQDRQVQGGMGVGSPISNEAYNVIAALHAKLEGLEAYRKFARDAETELWREMTENDVKCVEKLLAQLEQMVRDNKLRMVAPGTGARPRS